MRVIKVKTPIGEKEYPVYFSINFLEKVQKKYGSIDEIKNLVAKPSEFNWVLCELINEGIAAKNAYYNTSEELITEAQVSFFHLNEEASAVILEAFNDSIDIKKKMTMEDMTLVWETIQKI